VTLSVSLAAPLARLEQGAGAGPSDGTHEVVRVYLGAAREELVARHREGSGGAAINALHSDLMDRLVRRLFRRAERGYFASGHERAERAAVLAVGGYARREMSIHSDVDLLLLHAGSVTHYTTQLAEQLQYWLWDAGLTVGCATRTPEDTVKLARRDNTVFTGILDTRFLAGDPVFYHEFTDTLRRRLLSDVSAFLSYQLQATEDRHAAYGDSLYLLQPNLKEGAGGLRDYHSAIWAMRAVLPSARGADDLLHYGLLTETEMEGYSQALDFLWRIRNELHLLSGRRFDQMSFDHQERIAEALNYSERAPDDTLPVERFMGDYYRHARTIQSYSEFAIEQCVSRARPRRRRAPKTVEVEDGFQLREGKLEVPRGTHLDRDPLRLLRIFRVAQEREVELTRAARRLVRERLYLIDEDYCRNPAAAALFLELLNAEKRVMRSLMAMNECGVLGRFLPEWEHIVCRWQHVMYHTYTVDVHSIFLIEELRRLWGGKHEQELPHLTQLMRDVVDRPVLFLGCLLHDIGKGFGGDHSLRGEQRAERCLTRLGLAPERAERVLFLVRQHLVMSHVAQRRDLSDPRTVLEFARLVGDLRNLRLLYLLTFADIRASSNTAWTEWKGALLRELYDRTAELIETGRPDEKLALEQIQMRVASRRAAASDLLVGEGVSPEAIEAHFAGLPQHYVLSHTPRQIARHSEALRAFQARGDLTVRVRAMRGGFSELIVVCSDVHGLYSKVAGTLTTRRINILGSHVYTTRTGVALEVYRVTTPAGDDDDRGRAWEEFERSLASVLAGEQSLEALLRQRGPARFGETSTPSRLPAAVTVSNEESDHFTIVDVSTNDRLGLLYDLTRTFAEHDVAIHVSKAATILDQVADTFYVRDAADRKLSDPDGIEALRKALLDAATDGGGA